MDSLSSLYQVAVKQRNTLPSTTLKSLEFLRTQIPVHFLDSSSNQGVEQPPGLPKLSVVSEHVLKAEYESVNTTAGGSTSRSSSVFSANRSPPTPFDHSGALPFEHGKSFDASEMMSTLEEAFQIFKAECGSSATLRENGDSDQSFWSPVQNEVATVLRDGFSQLSDYAALIEGIFLPVLRRSLEAKHQEIPHYSSTRIENFLPLSTSQALELGSENLSLEERFLLEYRQAYKIHKAGLIDATEESVKIAISACQKVSTQLFQLQSSTQGEYQDQNIDRSLSSVSAKESLTRAEEAISAECSPHSLSSQAAAEHMQNYVSHLIHAQLIDPLKSEVLYWEEILDTTNTFLENKLNWNKSSFEDRPAVTTLLLGSHSFLSSGDLTENTDLTPNSPLASRQPREQSLLFALLRQIEQFLHFSSEESRSRTTTEDVLRADQKLLASLISLFYFVKGATIRTCLLDSSTENSNRTPLAMELIKHCVETRSEMGTADIDPADPMVLSHCNCSMETLFPFSSTGPSKEDGLIEFARGLRHTARKLVEKSTHDNCKCVIILPKFTSSTSGFASEGSFRCVAYVQSLMPSVQVLRLDEVYETLSQETDESEVENLPFRSFVRDDVKRQLLEKLIEEVNAVSSQQMNDGLLGVLEPSSDQIEEIVRSVLILLRHDNDFSICLLPAITPFDGNSKCLLRNLGLVMQYVCIRVGPPTLQNELMLAEALVGCGLVAANTAPSLSSVLRHIRALPTVTPSSSVPPYSEPAVMVEQTPQRSPFNSTLASTLEFPAAETHGKQQSSAPSHLDPTVPSPAVDNLKQSESALQQARRVRKFGRSLSPSPPPQQVPSWKEDDFTDDLKPHAGSSQIHIPTTPTSETNSKHPDHLSYEEKENSLPVSFLQPAGTKSSLLTPLSASTHHLFKQALLTLDHCDTLQKRQFSVVRVEKIENSLLQHGYRSKLVEIAMKHQESEVPSVPNAIPRNGEPTVHRNSQFSNPKLPSTSLTQFLPQLFDERTLGEIGSAPLNRLFLLHGTSSETASLIAKHGFDERVSNTTGLFGAGLYFTNTICKSHKYSKPRPVTTSGQKRTEHTVLICEVALGNCFVAKKAMRSLRRPPTPSARHQSPGGSTPSGAPRSPRAGGRTSTPQKSSSPVPKRVNASSGGGYAAMIRTPPAEPSETATSNNDTVSYDSVVGNGKSHKEFVVYDRSMVYPSYAVTYTVVE